MTKQRLICVIIIGCAMVVFLTKTSARVRVPLTGPDTRSLQGLTDAERDEAIEESFADRRLQNRKLAHKDLALLVREAWKNELRVSKQQWRIIEPKFEREDKVRSATWTGAACGLRKDWTFYWRKPTEDRGGGWAPPKTPEELTEGEKIVCELIDLLRQEDPNDAELRQKIDALQQAREKARKELPQAKRELAAVLTTPRQEAVLLVMGHID